MADSFLSPATAERIKNIIAPRGFATAKAVGTVLSISFWRDTDNNNDDGENVPAQDVLVIVAGADGRFGNSSQYRSDAERVQNATGELQKEPPFNVRAGDRFKLPPTHPDLPGVGCYVSEAPVAIGPYIRALFKTES